MNGHRRPGGPTRRRVLWVGAWVALATHGWAQDQVRNFGEPILVLNTGGHHAPIRSLAFSPDERRLFSAGEDKVVRQWDLAASPPGLDRTIRPPIFRGPAGAIQAMALSPPDARGRQRLATAGFGVQSSRGDIGVFRVPGAADRPEGDIERWLPGGVGDPRAAAGHVGPVECLAFSRDGALLASCGDDGTVRLWGPGGEPRGVIVSPVADPRLTGLTRVAFLPDGRLLSAGFDGVLRLWDAAARRLLAEAPPVGANPNDPAGVGVNALEVSPDGRWAVLGREDGFLVRFDLAAPGLAASAARLPTARRQASVEAVAFAPDGRLAVSLLSRRPVRSSDRPDSSCDVEIRRMPDGAVLESVFSAANDPPNPISNRVLALAFSPKGRYLAIGGGMDHAVYLRDLADPARGVVALVGQGSSVRDVGFVDPEPGAGDVPAVAYSHLPPSPLPPSFWGFALKDRAPTSFPTDRVRRALTAFQGWSVQPTSSRVLAVVRDGRKAFDVTLTDVDGRWWSYSFVPPGPGHDLPVLAVACRFGVILYRLEDGVRTRVLDGHSGSVFCVAPSGDGKWLATGSEDQTVRLWRLAGCDAIAPLGAEFEMRDGAPVAKSVAPRSFAEASGLAVGDTLAETFLGGKPVAAKDFLERFPAVPPAERIEYRIRRKGAKEGEPDRVFLAGTSRRDAPLLSLFVGRDREWVLWMPRGDYDSSVTGDSHYLGWHVNRATIATPASSDYFPLRTFEGVFRRPRGGADDALDRLLASADDRPAPGVPAAPRPVDVAADQPPVVDPVAAAGGAAIRDRDGAAIAPGAPLPDRIVIDHGEPLAVDWKVVPFLGRALGPFEVRFDGEVLRAPEVPALAPAMGAAMVGTQIDLAPGRHMILAAARNDKGITRERVIEVEVLPGPKPAPPPPEPPRLTILSIAPEFRDPRIPAVLHGPTDAADLAAFFDRYLVLNESGVPYPPADLARASFVRESATTEGIAAAISSLAEGPSRRGDTLIVIIESHVLKYGDGTKIAAADSQGFPPRGMVSADELATALGGLVRRGCRVVVFVDGLHTGTGRGWDADLNAWARRLRHEARVTTFLASSWKPSEVYRDRRVFTQAVLDAIQGPARRAPGAAASTLSLADFRRSVLEAVPRLSSRRQEAAAYIPDGIEGRTPLLNPRAPAR